MTKLLVIFLILIDLQTGTSTASAQDLRTGDAAATVTLHRTETVVLKSQTNGETYPIYVALPGSYYTSTREYPVVYMLDAYSSFGIVVQMARLLAFSQEVPEMIIVGISSEGGSKEFIYNRARDYTPTSVSQDKLPVNVRAMTPISGGAGKFLNFIGEQLIPMVESKYRVVPGDRTLAGHSYGGLFVFYSLFERPDLFKRYIAISPALAWDSALIEKTEAEYYQRNKVLNAVVYTAFGSMEPQDYYSIWNEFVSGLSKRKYDGFKIYSELIEKETHNSMVPFIATRGLRAVFSSR